MNDADDDNRRNATPSSPPRRNWHAGVRPHWIEIVLAVALVVVGVSQVYIYIQQAEIMSTQAQIAEAQQRPWLEAVPGANKRGIVFDDKGRFESDLTVNALNVGSLPAVETRVSAIILPRMGPAPFSVPRYQQETCLAAEVGDQIMFDNMPISSLPDKISGETPTIFPQKSVSTGWSFNISNPRFVFSQTIPRPIPQRLAAIFVGCIAYRIGSFSEKWHHTKFAFEIGKMTVVGSGFSFAPIADGMIQPEDVRFSQSYLGSNTAD